MNEEEKTRFLMTAHKREKGKRAFSSKIITK